MNFKESPLEGAYIITPSKLTDERGFFARSYCSNTFKELGLESKMPQSNMSFSKEKHTLRGMHYQTNGHEEAKLVRCVRGKILDVIIDLRPNSKTYKKHFAFELSQSNSIMLYVPKFFAHGFITLEENSEIFYQVSTPYNKANERGIRWNDPQFGINWPSLNPIISEKDAQHPNFID